MGKKKFLYSKDIKWVKVPHIKLLSIKEILMFAKENTDVNSYLPSYDYNKYPNRDWLCNVINTIANKKFCLYILKAMEQREKVIIMNRGLQIEAIPEIVSIFSQSKNVSVTSGRTHFLLRKRENFRKRTLQDREAEEAEEHKENIKKLSNKINELELMVKTHQDREDLFLQDKEKLVKLYQLGVIDSDGEYIEDK